MPESRSLRVLIVDDDPLFLDAVEALLERAENFEVVGRATNGAEALRRTAELLPDAITMDVDMPVMNGVEATRMIVAYFHVPVILLTASESGERIEEALAAGAVAHVYKANAWGDLIPTIRVAVARRWRH
jgi:CheY-like chemotaxis protein